MTCQKLLTSHSVEPRRMSGSEQTLFALQIQSLPHPLTPNGNSAEQNSRGIDHA